jgi:tungsten cofactor oxidoreducase radical SAM maturase
MPKVTLIGRTAVDLPAGFLERRQIPAGQEFWLSQRSGDLLLHPISADLQKLYIEPTTACNLECRTCLRNVWDDPIRHMRWETFAKILESLPALPQLRRVVFTSFGEPLTNPRLLDMIAAARRFDLQVTLGTNGLLLNREIARELIGLGVDRVVFSIDGGKPETYRGVRGAMLSQVIDNLRDLNEVKRQLGSLFPFIGVEFVAMRSNIAELGDLTRLAADMEVSRLLISNVLPYTADLLNEKLYSYSPIPPLQANGWPLRVGAWITWATCEVPRMHWGADRRCRFVNDRAAVIGWDGGVAPCYALSHNYRYFTIDGRQKKVERYLLGNVHQQSLVDIWTSEDYVCFRSEVQAFHFPSCPDCDLRETCDLRVQNLGCWGWDPSCADCLWAQNIVLCP